MKIHQEGFKIIPIAILLLALAAWGISLLLPPGFYGLAVLAALIPLGLILNFFRNPDRTINAPDEQLIFAPADGQVVVIEETMEGEYLKEKRIQVSIFMSIFNVHANRIPIAGTLEYFQHHQGKYLVARHPKSSTENERTTVVINHEKGKILLRQIAGYVARRVQFYLSPGQEVKQGQEMGFIRFGSRVDLFLPVDAEILVNIGDQVKGNIDAVAKW